MHQETAIQVHNDTRLTHLTGLKKKKPAAASYKGTVLTKLREATKKKKKYISHISHMWNLKYNQENN